MPVLPICVTPPIHVANISFVCILLSGYIRNIVTKENIWVPKDILNIIIPMYYNTYYKNVLKTQEDKFSFINLFANYSVEAKLAKPDGNGTMILDVLNRSILSDMLHDHNTLQFIMTLDVNNEDTDSIEPIQVTYGLLYPEHDQASAIPMKVLKDINYLQDNFDLELIDYQYSATYIS